MLRNCVSTRPPGCAGVDCAGGVCAAASRDLTAANDIPASAVAESCMVSRRDIFIVIGRLQCWRIFLTTLNSVDHPSVFAIPLPGHGRLCAMSNATAPVGRTDLAPRTVIPV